MNEEEESTVIVGETFTENGEGGSNGHKDAADLGSLLKLMLRKLSKQLNDPPYNFMIHTAPLELPPSCSPYVHWFLQIVPQLNRLAGFEMASGCFINPIFPEDAAKVLKEVDCSI